MVAPLCNYLPNQAQQAQYDAELFIGLFPNAVNRAADLILHRQEQHLAGTYELLTLPSPHGSCFLLTLQECDECRDRGGKVFQKVACCVTALGRPRLARRLSVLGQHGCLARHGEAVLLKGHCGDALHAALTALRELSDITDSAVHAACTLGERAHEEKAGLGLLLDAHGLLLDAHGDLRREMK